MSDDSSNDSGSADLKQTLESVNQITRDFENLATQLQRDSAIIATLSMQSQRSAGRIPANQQTTALPAVLQAVAQSLAREKALGKQLINDVAAFAEALNRLAVDNENRISQQDRPDSRNQVPRYSAADRAAEAAKLERLAQSLLEKAQDEEQEANLAVWQFGMGDEYERHKSTAKAARDAAEEMQRRAYILTHGQEDNYRQLMLDQYGINNPDLDSVAGYFAERFNDQETLNWLSRQHPAPRDHLDFNSIAMMFLIGPAVRQLSLLETPVKVDDPPLPPNYNAIVYVREPTTIMSEKAAAYQEAAPASRYAMAPRLSAVDLSGKITANFDGVDVSTGEMVDPKIDIVGSKKFIKEALRQSATAAQNGFSVRWEVPNAAVQSKAQQILSTSGIKNIRVVIRPIQ